MTSAATRGALQPTVLSSASSPCRSSTDIAIVLVTLIAPRNSAMMMITCLLYTSRANRMVTVTDGVLTLPETCLSAAPSA